jgi:hypothetical protein
MDNLESRNRCVFDGANPHMVEALILAGEERPLSTMAGVKGLYYLTAPSPRRLECVCHVIFVIFPYLYGRKCNLKKGV